MTTGVHRRRDIAYLAVGNKKEMLMETVIFQKEIYATACVLGGVSYWAIVTLGFPIEIATMCSFLITCVIRLVAVRYHIALPKLKD